MQLLFKELLPHDDFTPTVCANLDFIYDLECIPDDFKKEAATVYVYLEDGFYHIYHNEENAEGSLTLEAEHRLMDKAERVDRDNRIAAVEFSG